MSTTPFTLKNPFTRFDIDGDRELFEKIFSDMCNNAGELAPADRWSFDVNLSTEDNAAKIKQTAHDFFNQGRNRLLATMDHWVGDNGMIYVSKEVCAKYELFLRGIDHLGVLADDIYAHGQSNGWNETDLGSIIDINLISAFAPEMSTDRITVCEVGGGYGRLAEIFLSQVWKEAHYVMIDAVPVSLMYSYLYLKTQFPDKKIGSYYTGDEYNTDYDCYIMPAWRSQVLEDSSFDITINIESLQETSQLHYDHYIKLFDRLTRPKGLIYISNARDFVFKGDWHIPAHWKTLYMNNTPRGWTADHPTHILEKNSGDYSVQRKIFEGTFLQQIDAYKLKVKTTQQKDSMHKTLKLKIKNMTRKARSPSSANQDKQS